MSLLLEALKKAADAKRQQEEERIYQRTGQRFAVTDEMLAEHAASATASEEARAGESRTADVPAETGDYRQPLSHAEAVAGIGDDGVDSQRVAHSVFDSKTPFAGERVRKGLLLIGALVAVFGMLAMGGYSYYRERDDQLRLQLADVRSARHQAIPRQQTDPPAPLTQTVETPAPDDEAEVPVVAAPMAEADPVKSPAPAPEPVVAAPQPAVASHAQEATVEKAPAQGEPAALSIVRNDTRERIADRLAAGYRAFQAGDLGGSQSAYAEALQLDASSRDALLGLAAIAVKRGDNERALSAYRTLLQKNPRDVVAAAALSSLPDSGSVRARESELKLLLQRNPGAAELHFALGTLYSNERRWPEAQAAFFEAHRNDASNPDFMFNLAVSLDHLNKAPNAAEYYRKALTAAQAGAANFDLDAARQRLRALSETRGEEN